jgi:hypothetical protein
MYYRHVALFLIVAGLLGVAQASPAHAAAPCSGINHTEVVTVYADAQPVSGAIVTFYLDSGRQNVADNLLLTGQNDAIVTTGSDGTATIALAQGSYFVRIIAKNNQTYEPSIVMPADGTCSHNDFSLTQAGQTSMSPENTTVTLSPTSIISDGVQSATLTIQARNAIGSVMSNQTVDLQTNLGGMFITHNATVTDAAGKATFTIRATMPGNAQLMPYVNGQLIKPTILTVTNAVGVGAVGSSATISPSASTMTATPSIVESNGIAASQVTVTLRDANGAAVSGVSISPRTTLNGSVFAPVSAVSNASGIATFTFVSPMAGLATVTAIAGTVGLNDRPNVQFGVNVGTGGVVTPPSGSVGHQGIGVPAFVPVSTLRGTLIKLEDDGDPKTTIDSTVYYVGNDNMRHAFPDEKTYFSWYVDYVSVTLVSPSTMATIPLGSNVTYRPGVTMIKFPSDNKVYAVEGKRSLRWVTTGFLAQELYGSNWAKKINDISEAFAASYQYGSDITSAADFNVSRETTQAATIETVLGR